MIIKNPNTLPTILIKNNYYLITLFDQSNAKITFYILERVKNIEK